MQRSGNLRLWANLKGPESEDHVYKQPLSPLMGLISAPLALPVGSVNLGFEPTFHFYKTERKLMCPVSFVGCKSWSGNRKEFTASTQKPGEVTELGTGLLEG